jgi:hypothetical protein
MKKLLVVVTLCAVIVSVERAESITKWLFKPLNKAQKIEKRSARV